MNKIIVNLDLHGGDFAPISVIEGARIALTKYNNLMFRFHAHQSTYNQYYKIYSDLFEKSEWIESENFIPATMKPSEALKKENRKSSMSNAIASLKDNKDQITVSAGNTGAMLAYSTVYLRTIENISRPAIASLFPSKLHPVCFLDLGANSECDAKNLHDFALMGSTYYKILYPNADCKVSLLNIGSEELKGNKTIQEANELLKNDKNINYQGFIEANAITSTDKHIIVTDGFSGNIALKTAEGISEFITSSLKNNLTTSFYSKFLSFLLKNNFKKFKNSIDPRNFNGGIFIGVNGIVIKSHGNADSHSYANAIDFGIKCIKADLLNQIKKNVSR